MTLYRRIKHTVDQLENKISKNDYENLEGDHGKGVNSKENCAKISTWQALLVICCLILSFGLTIYVDESLPRGLTLDDSATQTDSFIEERAREYLRGIVKFGPRPVYSHENAVIAHSTFINYFLRFTKVEMLYQNLR